MTLLVLEILETARRSTPQLQAHLFGAIAGIAYVHFEGGNKLWKPAQAWSLDMRGRYEEWRRQQEKRVR